MFDIGFAELLLIAVVALLVLGPERLPGTVRTVSIWLARIKRQAGEIRREIEREVDADGIRRDIHNERVLADLERERRALQSSLEETRASVEDAVRPAAPDAGGNAPASDPGDRNPPPQS